MDLPILNRDSWFELFDDFHNLDVVRWTAVKGTGGTNTANTYAGGQVSIKTAASASDYQLMTSAAQIFKFAAGKPALFEAEFVHAEAATNKANICLGMTSVTTSGFMAASNGGPATSFSGAMFYKTGGGMSLGFMTSNATAQSINPNLYTLVAGNTYRVGFEFIPGTGTVGGVKPYVYDVTNGILVNTDGKSSQGLILPITLASLAAMNLVYGVNAGSASAESLNINHILGAQAR